MADWDVSDVVALLKTFGLSRDVLIFVFRHNIDGTTMDESVELLVKDFQLADEETERSIIDKWKDITSKGLTPAQVLRPASLAATVPSKLQQFPEPTRRLQSNPDIEDRKEATMVTDDAAASANNKEVDSPPAVFTHLRTSAWSRSGKFSAPVVENDEIDADIQGDSNATENLTENRDIEVVPQPAVFTHLRTSAWSRSAKVLASEMEAVATQPETNIPSIAFDALTKGNEPLFDEGGASDGKSREQDEIVVPASAGVSAVVDSPPTAAPVPRFSKAISFVDQVMAVYEELPNNVTTPIVEPAVVSAVLDEQQVVEEKVSEPASSDEGKELIPEAAENINKATDVEAHDPDLDPIPVTVSVPTPEVITTSDVVAAQASSPVSRETTSPGRNEPVVEGDSYATEDWEAELEDLHKHSVVETPARTITPPVNHIPAFTDTVGFEPESNAEEESIPDESPRMKDFTHCDVDDLEDPELDDIIAQQTEEYNVRVSQKVYTTPVRSSVAPAPAPAPAVTNDKEAEIIAKYEQEMKKQAELLRLQHEQIQLQKQLIEQQRRDLSEASPRSKVHTTKHSPSLSSHKRSNKQSLAARPINDTFVPVRAALNYDLSDRTGSPSKYTDNTDMYYPQQALVSMPHDSISMLSDSGIFDMYQSNFPFPGVFLPESSITSQNSGEYETYRKQNDITPPPGVLKNQISKLTSDGGYEEQIQETQRPYYPSYQENSTGYSDQQDQNDVYHGQSTQHHNAQDGQNIRHIHQHDSRDMEVDRDSHDRPLPESFSRASPRTHSGAYDHTQLTEASTDSAGHVWHHTQARRAQRNRVPAPHAPVPSLNLNTTQAVRPLPVDRATSDRTTGTHTSSSMVPETSSPKSPRKEDAGMSDLFDILKQLASTNIALTHALRPIIAPQQEIESAVPFTSRSAPAAQPTNPDARGRHNTFRSDMFATTTTDNSNINTNTNTEQMVNIKQERPPWDDHTERASLALLTARSAPQGRPGSRQSTSSSGARSTRRRHKSDQRAQPAPKPVLQDYIDLLAQQFAAKPLCQTPYFASFTSNAPVSVDAQDRFSHNQQYAHQNYNIHAALDKEPSFLHPYQYRPTTSSQSDDQLQISNLPRIFPFSAPPSPAVRQKGGIILLQKSPTEIVFEGPHYAAPIERKEENSGPNETSRAATSPGKKRSISPHYAAPLERKTKDLETRPLYSKPPSPGKSRPPSRLGSMAARPHTGSDTANTSPRSAPSFVDSPTEALAISVPPAAPPSTGRPGTTGNKSRNKARVLVPAAAQI